MQDVGQPLVKAAQDDTRDRALAALLLSGVGGVSGGIAGYMRGGEKRKRKALIGALLGAGLGAGTPYLHKALSGDKKPETPVDEPVITPEMRAKGEELINKALGGSALAHSTRQGIAVAGTAGSAVATHKLLAPLLERGVGRVEAYRILRQAARGDKGAQTMVKNYLATSGLSPVELQAQVAAGTFKPEVKNYYDSIDEFIAAMTRAKPKASRSLISRLLRRSKSSPASHLNSTGMPIQPKATGSFYENLANLSKARTGATETHKSIAKEFRRGIRGPASKTWLPKTVGTLSKGIVPLAVGLKLWPDAASRLAKDLDQ
jgi:hypothetical protein